MVAEVRNAIEEAVMASGMRLAGRDAVASRTDELDLTLGGKFDPKRIPAYRALVIATHALAVTLTPRADGEIMITGVLSDMFTGQARETGSEQVSVLRLVATATSQTKRLCQATIASAAASVLTSEEAIGTLWKTPDDVFRDQHAVSEVDKAGLLLEMLMQRPWDREVFGRLVGDLPYGAQWWVEALSQTVLDRLQPESFEKAQMIVLLSSSRFQIITKNKQLNTGRPGFRFDERTMKLFEEIASLYPGTSVAADCQFRIGCWQRDRGEFEAAAISFGKAEAEYRQLMADTDSLCPAQFKSRFSADERLRYEQSILKGYALSCASMLYNQGLSWQESGKTEESNRAYDEAWTLADAHAISRAEVMRSAGVTKAGKTGKTAPASVYLESDLRTALAGAQTEFSDRFVVGAEAYVRSDFETAFDAWSEVATRAEHPVLVVMAGRNILLGMSSFPMERRQPVAEPFLRALPTALEQGRCLSLRDFDKAVSAAVYLLGEDPKQAAGISPIMVGLEAAYAKHRPDDRRGPASLARLYLDCRLYEDCIRLCEDIARPGSAAYPDQKYFWEVISLCAKAIRASKGVDAQLAYQKKWAGIKEPADAQLLGDIFFVEAVKGIADAFKAEGRIAEAATLYEKLTHAYENSPVPDNWKGIDPNWTLPVATMRYGCMMHWAECLEVMKDIDGAVFIYKRVVRECDGRDIQRPDSQGPLDKVAGKRLEVLRAQQEKARMSEDGQSNMVSVTPVSPKGD
jgi:tetratricopeptide (TPR) repeat protein